VKVFLRLEESMEQKGSLWLRLLGTVFGITLLVSLIVVGIGVFFQWNTPTQFSNGFFAAGMLVVVFGILSVTGGFQQRASFPLSYAETASDASISERAQRMMADINQRYGMMILMIGSGIVLIAISIAVYQLF
jgi:hypothetical protein